MARFKLRAHHISNVADSYFYSFSNFDWMFEEYPEDFKLYVGMIHAQIIYNPLAEIMVVRGLDDICQNPYAYCGDREKTCADEFALRDDLCEKLYRLSLRRVYSSGQILSILINFRQEFGYICPEEWLKAQFFGNVQKLLQRITRYG